jgi:RIP metalloprotease RseP
VKPATPLGVVEAAGSELKNTLKATVAGYARLFKSLVGGGSKQGLSGPIAVIKMGSDVAKTQDFSALASFAAALSVNLAVLNAFPFPALDGGQLAVVLGEAITRKRADQKTIETVTALGFLALLGLSVSTVIGDVVNLLK